MKAWLYSMYVAITRYPLVSGIVVTVVSCLGAWYAIGGDAPPEPLPTPLTSDMSSSPPASGVKKIMDFSGIDRGLPLQDPFQVTIIAKTEKQPNKNDPPVRQTMITPPAPSRKTPAVATSKIQVLGIISGPTPQAIVQVDHQVLVLAAGERVGTVTVRYIDVNRILLEQGGQETWVPV